MAYEISDSIEPAQDIDVEVVADGHNGVIWGCALTYDAANMTFDIAAGAVLIDGVVTAVSAQANAETLVADGTNPRWTLIGLNSSATGVIVSGTAAANPSKAELGTIKVLLGAVKVEAGQTIANNITTKLDKRIMLRGPYLMQTTADQVLTQNSTTMQAVTGLAFPLPASGRFKFEALVVYLSGTTPDFKMEFTSPAGEIHYRAVVEVANASDGQWGNASGADLAPSDGAGVTVDSNERSVRVSGYVIPTAAGTLQIQAAQNTGDLSDTTVKEGSWLEVNKVG